MQQARLGWKNHGLDRQGGNEIQDNGLKHLGQYRFADFVKVGVPFTVLVMLVTVLMVPWFFGL